MAFDFWDDVIKPAWYDVVQCNITDEMFNKLRYSLDSSLADKIEDKFVARDLLYLCQSEESEVFTNVGKHDTLAMMMTFCRSHAGVERFIQALRVSSSQNEIVVILLENIWHKMKDKHPARDLQEHSKLNVIFVQYIICMYVYLNTV